MAKVHEKTPAGRIFDNIIFLEEVFGDRANREIPKVPVLELARCFDLRAQRRSESSGGVKRNGHYGNNQR